MSDMTTFGAFNTARLGIWAAQKSLDVTGHNISNINTEGYTRQKVDQVSLRVGVYNHVATSNGGRAGSGVMLTGMSQFRDPYLDIRYRTEVSNVGSMDAKLAGLQDLAAVLDEVGDNEGNGYIENQFNDLVTQLEGMLTDHATEGENQTLVRSSAESLTQLFREYSKRLEQVADDQEKEFRQDIDDVNIILKNIAELNDSIRKSDIYGDSALELRDQRNLLIDQLSQYIKIDVSYVPVPVGAGATVDKLVITTAGEDGKALVDGAYAGQLSIDEDADGNSTRYATNADGEYLKPDGTVTTDPTQAETIGFALNLSVLTNRKGVELKGSNEVKFGDTELHGSLQASREILTEEGEFTTEGTHAVDPGATSKRGIPYYQDALDALAKKFAEVMNAANSGFLHDSDGNYVDENGNILRDGSGNAYQYDPTVEMTDALRSELIGAGGVELGGTLFTNSASGTGTDGITAGNIHISKAWATGEVNIQNSFVQSASKPGEVASSDTSNLLHIIAAINGSNEYRAQEIEGDAVQTGNKPYFEGNFQQMLSNISGTLAKDIRSTQSFLDNYSAAATELSVNRESVSGVDLNDEAINLMQYQKSYSAACRLMTTLDEVLDKLINGTAI